MSEEHQVALMMIRDLATEPGANPYHALGLVVDLAEAALEGKPLPFDGEKLTMREMLRMIHAGLRDRRLEYMNAPANSAYRFPEHPLVNEATGQVAFGLTMPANIAGDAAQMESLRGRLENTNFGRPIVTPPGAHVRLINETGIRPDDCEHSWISVESHVALTQTDRRVTDAWCTRCGTYSHSPSGVHLHRGRNVPFEPISADGRFIGLLRREIGSAGRVHCPRCGETTTTDFGCEHCGYDFIWGRCRHDWLDRTTRTGGWRFAAGAGKRYGIDK